MPIHRSDFANYRSFILLILFGSFYSAFSQLPDQAGTHSLIREAKHTASFRQSDSPVISIASTSDGNKIASVAGNRINVNQGFK